MKFAIATVAYWDSIGFDITHWRKSLDGTKAICHLDYAKKLGTNLYNNPEVKIYDSADPELKEELGTGAWLPDGTSGDLDIHDFLDKLRDLEDKMNNDLNTKMSKVEDDLTASTTYLEQKIEANKQESLLMTSQIGQRVEDSKAEALTELNLLSQRVAGNKQIASDATGLVDQKTEKNKQDISEVNKQLQDYKDSNDTDKLSLTAQLQENKNDLTERFINIKRLPSPYISAVGDGVADDTQAIKNAVEIASGSPGVDMQGGVVYIPPGDYKWSEELMLERYKLVSFVGSGKASNIIWGGETGGNFIYASGTLDEHKIYFKNFRVSNPSKINGVKFFKSNKEFGNTTAGEAIVNVTFEGMQFSQLDTCIEISKESDQFSIVDCYFLAYTHYGFRAINGTNNNIHIERCHFRGGATDSWAIVHENGGNNLTIDKTTIQSGMKNAKGIRVDNIRNLKIGSIYYENTGTTDVTQLTNCILMTNVDTATIKNMTSTGNVGANIIYIGENCKNIEIGPNTHGVSGGHPTQFVFSVAKTSTRIIGLQTVTGVNPEFVKTTNNDLLFDYVLKKDQNNEALRSKQVGSPPMQMQGTRNAGNGALIDIYTVSTELPNATYLVTVYNNFDGHASVGILVKTSASSIFTPIKETSSQLVVSFDAPTATIKAMNTSGTTRTLAYSLMTIGYV